MEVGMKKDMHDERNEEIRNKFPLRKIRLDTCECGHDDSDHLTVQSSTGVKDGNCAVCVCKGFHPMIGEKNEQKTC